MLGNVWEWCYDWYDRGGPRSRINQSTSTYRVVRGGSFVHLPGMMRCADRDKGRPTAPGVCNGFRVGLGVKKDQQAENSGAVDDVVEGEPPPRVILHDQDEDNSVKPADLKPKISRVIKPRTNIRARPSFQAETLGQLNLGDKVSVLSRNSMWVETEMPPGVYAWIHKDFVSGNKVIVKKLNARSGPGINYNVLGSFTRGDRVDQLKTFGDWLQVKPPIGASVWISSSCIE